MASVLSIRNLTVVLPKLADRIYAVENLTLEIQPKGIVCIVDESGSGKCIATFATMGLLPPARRPSSGEIIFGGQDFLQVSPLEHAKLRGAGTAMIFQEPMNALNPYYIAGDQIEEMFELHTKLMQEVQRPQPGRLHFSYPHLHSGGNARGFASPVP